MSRSAVRESSTAVVLLTFWKRRVMEFHCACLDENDSGWSLKQRLRYRVKYRFYRLVALTEQDREFRERLLGQRVYNIPNPMYKVTSQFSTQENRRMFVLARLCPQKNIPALLRAWDRVQTIHPDWTLDIYGEGEDKEEIMRIIREKGLSSVRLMGYVNNPFEVIPYYSLMLFPSLFEGFGMTLIESMACGVPCVAYDCKCGPSEIISDGVDGVVVPLNDMDGFIDKVIYLIENIDVRRAMSVRCRESIKRYDMDIVMRMWVNFFDEI